MGGHIFSQAVADGHPVLQTPRMSREKYNQLKEIYLPRLQRQFPNAESIEVAVEAPGKSDFGDIDFIIFDRGLVDWAAVAEAVGAVAWVKRGREDEPACSLAVTLDGEPSAQKPVQYVLVNEKVQKQPANSAATSEPYFGQIDLVQIAPDLKKWSMFISSYGDVGGILGMAALNFGFSINDRG